MFAEMGRNMGAVFGGLARAAEITKDVEERKTNSITRRMEAEAKLLNAQNASRRLDLREMETAPPAYVMIDGARPQIEPQ